MTFLSPILLSLLALLGGGFALLMLLGIMTGCDLRNPTDMAALVIGTSIIAAAVIVALYFVWRGAGR